MTRCNDKHPMLRLVRCEEPAKHSGDHFNSFYNRRWPNESTARGPRWLGSPAKELVR